MTRAWLVLCACSSLAGALPAQQVTGALAGRVTDADSGGLEGAAVAVSGPFMQGTRGTVSDARGRFVVPLLPAGSYVVAIRRIGFAPVRLDSVPVHLGSTTSLGDVRLQARAIEVAELVASGAKPVIDPVSAAAGTSIDSSRLATLPSSRDFRGLVAFMPQANASPYGDGVNIGGSTGWENAFYVDGANVTTSIGTSMSVPFGFVRELQVSTGGYEAEFGRALAGVVNVVTPSGGNTFHAQVLGYYTGDALRSAPRVGIGQVDPSGQSAYDVGVQVSGPIHHDRLWFFAAWNPSFTRQRAAVAALPDQLDSRVQHLLAGKLTWLATPRTEVAVTVLGDPATQDAVLTNLLPASASAAPALTRVTDGGTAVSARLRHELSPNVHLQLAVERSSRRSDNQPRTGPTTTAAVTRIDDYTTNASSGGVGGYVRGGESRSAIRASVTGWRGAHAAKIGVEYEANRVNTAGDFSVISRTADSTWDWIDNAVTARVYNNVPTIYVQDAWAVSRRLTVNGGVRLESQRFGGASGPARTVQLEVAPRLGLVYQPGVPGSQRLFASYGRFFEQLPAGGMIFWNGSGRQLVREFPQNPLVDSSNGAVLGTYDYTFVPLVAELLGQAYDQVSAGYERTWRRAWRVGVRGTLRRLRWAIEDGIAPGDSVYRMGNPGRGALAAMGRSRQRYASLELSVERATPGPLYLLASWVVSRNTGNYTGLFPTDIPPALPNSGTQYDVADQLPNADGLLPNDRTHMVKVAASYRFRFGVTVGGFFTAASGVPLSEFGSSAFGAYYVTFLRPRGTAGRTPALWSLDLHASADLPGFRSRRPAARLLVDVFNVGSPRRAMLYDQRHYLDAGMTQVNPNYRAVTQYQAPMSARVGMQLDFEDD